MKLSQIIVQGVLLIIKLCPTSFSPSLRTYHGVNVAKRILHGHVKQQDWCKKKGFKYDIFIEQELDNISIQLESTQKNVALLGSSMCLSEIQILLKQRC
jgi:hypothetical protein